MSWLDANEVFLMEVVTRDRVDDLRSSADLATASAEGAGAEGAPPCVDDDGALLATLRRRDSTSAERLVARYGSRAYRLAIRITRNAADAEEVVQDAFWSVIRKIDTFRGDAAFGTWLYRIVANAACQKLRRVARHRTEISLEEVLPSFHDDARSAAPIEDWSGRLDDPALRSDLRSALGAAIDDLSPDYRAVVVLHDVEGLSMVEVARSTGITVANAKTRLHRARLFLRKRLGAFMETTSSGDRAAQITFATSLSYVASGAIRSHSTMNRRARSNSVSV
jgi:RNA polymerase sigma-70 factor (ECF subfamily)